MCSSALLLCLGCTDFTLRPVDPEDPLPKSVIVRESFVQAPLPKLDLLIVIDDTASMAQEQASLASDFSSLLEALDTLEIGWQLGVVTTDMSGPEAGWLVGSPWILTPDLPLRDEIFSEMIQVGVSGSGPEAGLAAAATALDLCAVGGPNAGFRRDDALLHILFVSDADDQSEEWLGADPPAPFLERLSSEAARTELPAKASALVGPLPAGCSSSSGVALPAARYERVAADSGGVLSPICAADLAPVLASLSDVSVVWQRDFELREIPEPGSLRAELNGEPTEEFTLIGDILSFDAPPAPESRIDVRYLVRMDSL